MIIFFDIEFDTKRMIIKLPIKKSLTSSALQPVIMMNNQNNQSIVKR